MQESALPYRSSPLGFSRQLQVHDVIPLDVRPSTSSEPPDPEKVRSR